MDYQYIRTEQVGRVRRLILDRPQVRNAQSRRLSEELNDAFLVAEADLDTGVVVLTGAGDHPAFVKAFNKLAAFVTEGSHVSGKGPSDLGQQKPGAPTKPSAAQALYPNLPSN